MAQRAASLSCMGGRYLVKVGVVWPSACLPVKLLQEILGQEGEEGIFGRADPIAGVSPGDLGPVSVEQAVVGEYNPLLRQAAALSLLLWGQQWCGFCWRLEEAISESPLPPVPRGVHREGHFWQHVEV